MPTSQERYEGESDGDALHRRRLHAVKHELAVLRTQARIAGRAQQEMAKRWQRANYGLAIPASLLAVLSGAAILTEAAGAAVAGVMAVLSAICSGVLAILNPAHRAVTAVDATRNYITMENQAAYVENVELNGEDDVAKASNSLAQLVAWKADVNARADLPHRRVWWAAVRAEGDGHGSYGDIREFTRPEEYVHLVQRPRRGVDGGEGVNG